MADNPAVIPEENETTGIQLVDSILPIRLIYARGCSFVSEREFSSHRAGVATGISPNNERDPNWPTRKR